MPHAARKPVANFIVPAIAALLLYGCGQRGPLFLPDEAPSEVTESAPPAAPGPTSETTPAPAPETTPAPRPADNPAPEEGKGTERKPDEKPR